jgi:hypothetical protein
MNKLHSTLIALSLVTVAAGAYAFSPGDDGHKVKVKIVKIVDGDTTTIEKTLDEKELDKMNADLNNVKGKNVKVMMFVSSDDKEKDGSSGSPQGRKEEKITMNKTFTFDVDSLMKTCKVEVNIDSLIGSVMNGFNMTVTTDGDDGKGEKKIIIKKGNGKEENINIQKFGDDEDGSNTIIITTPDDKGDKKDRQVIIKKEKGSGNSYSYSMDSDDGDVSMDFSDGDEKGSKNNVIVITTKDKDGKNGKKVIVKSSVIVIDDADSKKDGRKEKSKDKESAEDLKFYPNPSDGKFTVEYDLKSKETAVLTITDASGKQLFKDEIRGGGKYVKQIDLGGKGKGVFILNLQQGRKSISRKIVIE